MRRRTPFVFAPVVAALSLVAAGCGSGGSSPGVANVAPSTTTSTGATQSGGSTQVGSVASAFAFARCMRAHGIPGWPDPNKSGYFDKSRLLALPISPARIRALESGPCNIPLPDRPDEQPITRAERVDYLRAAHCMRTHGVPGFPDPTFQGNSLTFNIPSTINKNDPRVRHAVGICELLIPAGLPYSGDVPRSHTHS